MADATRGRLLLGAFPTPGEATAFVSRYASETAAAVEERWPGAREAFLETDGASGSTAVEQVDGGLRDAICEALDTPLTKASLSGRSWQLASVPLRSLVTPQPVVSLAHVELMQERLERDVVPCLFPTDTTVEVKADVLPGPTIVLTSTAGETAVSGARVHQPDGRRLDLVLQVEPRPNYVSVLRAGDSLVLRNGNHRLVAAWRAGLRSTPAVVVDADGAGGLEDRSDRFARTTLSASRPPRLADFADGSAACIDVQLPRRTVQTLVQVDQRVTYDVP